MHVKSLIKHHPLRWGSEHCSEPFCWLADLSDYSANVHYPPTKYTKRTICIFWKIMLDKLLLNCHNVENTVKCCYQNSYSSQMQGTGKFLWIKALERRRLVQAVTIQAKMLTREQLLWTDWSARSRRTTALRLQVGYLERMKYNLGWYREVNSPLSASLQVGVFIFIIQSIMHHLLRWSS